jgi:hypothetical protein
MWLDRNFYCKIVLKGQAVPMERAHCYAGCLKLTHAFSSGKCCCWNADCRLNKGNLSGSEMECWGFCRCLSGAVQRTGCALTVPSPACREQSRERQDGGSRMGKEWIPLMAGVVLRESPFAEVLTVERLRVGRFHSWMRKTIFLDASVQTTVEWCLTSGHRICGSYSHTKQFSNSL